MLTTNLSIATGIDLVHIPRVKQMYEKFYKAFLDKVLTEPEQEYCLRNGNVNINDVAKRFATKEAFSKALGCGIGAQLGFKDVWVEHQGSTLTSSSEQILKKPLLKLSEKAHKYLLSHFNAHSYQAEVSLSDDTDYACASVFLLLNKNS